MTKIVCKKKHALLRYKKQMSVYRFDCTINTLLIAFASDRIVLFVFRIFLESRYDVWIELCIPSSLSFAISLSTSLRFDELADEIQSQNCQFAHTFPLLCNSFDLFSFCLYRPFEPVRASEFVYGTMDRFANLRNRNWLILSNSHTNNVGDDNNETACAKWVFRWRRKQNLWPHGFASYNIESIW